MPMTLTASLPVNTSMWTLTQPWWEFMLRALLVYGFLLLTLRLTGKRQVGQLAPFDLVLLLVLSNAVQNSMNAGDNTVGAGFILVATLLLVNAVVTWFTFRSKAAESIFEGKPKILVHDGKTDDAMIVSERITKHELMAAIRQAGLVNLEDVKVAILETNGRINVIARKSDASASILEGF
jgi:uncharacterized membrane protein YcaP (DUF421 family)